MFVGRRTAPVQSQSRAQLEGGKDPKSVLRARVPADNSRVMRGLLARVHLLAEVFIVLLVATGTPVMAATLVVQWDPNPEPNITGYRVYIGTESGQYDRVEDIGIETAFAMTNARPGIRYFFAVAAVAGWRLSEKSVEVSAVWEESRRTSGSRSSHPGPAFSGETCTGTSIESCFRYAPISTLPGEAHSLSASPGGQLFVVEDHQRIRAVSGGQPAAEPAYVATDARLEHVVVDPAFARTGWVFTSETTRRRDGTFEANIVRLSYLAGTLGQPARIVTGIAVAPGTGAPFALSPSGVIYVAAPGGIRGTDSERVLAFTIDGRPLRDPATSALLSGAGLRDPVSMWLGDGSDLPWLAGRNGQGEAVAGPVDMSGTVRVSARIDGEPAATAGPFGLVAIQGGKVIATAPGLNGTIVAAVVPQTGATDERTVIIRLTPAR